MSAGEGTQPLFDAVFKKEKSSRNLNDSGSFLWQRVKDSNPHIQSQSLLCYLYTNPLYLFVSK